MQILSLDRPKKLLVLLPLIFHVLLLPHCSMYIKFSLLSLSWDPRPCSPVIRLPFSFLDTHFHSYKEGNIEFQSPRLINYSINHSVLFWIYWPGMNHLETGTAEKPPTYPVDELFSCFWSCDKFTKCLKCRVRQTWKTPAETDCSIPVYCPLGMQQPERNRTSAYS